MEWDLWPIVKFTLWQSSIVTAVSLLLGSGFALLERRYQAITPRWWSALCTLPVFLPPLLVSTGFVQLFGQAGDLNTLLHALHLPPIQLLYRPSAVVLAHLYYNIPLAYLATHATLARLSQHTEEAARLLGASRWQIMQTIWWPQLKGTVLGIGAVIFLYCWTSFTLPLQLGGSTAKTVEVWLYEQIKLLHQPELALGVAIVQTLIFVLPILIVIRSLPTPTQHFVPSTLRPIHSVMLLRWLATLALLAPLLSLITHIALHTSTTTIETLWRSQFGESLLRSLLLMLVVLSISIILSVLLRRARNWTLLLLTLSPVTVAALWLTYFGQGLSSLAAALCISLLPLGSYLVHSGYSQLPPALLETAKILGANRWQQLHLEWRWLWPAMRQLLSIGVVLVLGDIALASLLTPNAQPTAMQVTYSLFGSYRYQVGGLALITLLIVLFLLQLIIHYSAYAHRRQS